MANDLITLTPSVFHRLLELGYAAFFAAMTFLGAFAVCDILKGEARGLLYLAVILMLALFDALLWDDLKRKGV